nr:SHOCT domain-containing protein [uncultured Roseateles sp.]
MKLIQQANPLVNLLAAGILAAGLAGCASSSRSTVTVQDSTKITKGQELVDLQRALDQGAITQGEFEELRQVILRRP